MEKQVKKQVSLEKYMGHYIRKVEDEFGYEHVFIDMPCATFESAPALKRMDEWEYASVADAKRVIRGEMPKYVPMDLVEYLGMAKYMSRFGRANVVDLKLKK